MGKYDNLPKETRELLEAVDILNQHRIDEVSISIPRTKADIQSLEKTPEDKFTIDDAEFTLYIRTSEEATRGKTASSSGGMYHGPGIKIYRGRKNYDLAVPTKSFEIGDAETKKDLKAIKEFAENSSFPKDVNKIAVRFIFDNQMLIAAYWFTTDKRCIEVLRRLAKQKLIDNNYAKNNVKAKSQEELDKDKQELNEYVRKELDDSSIELDFGKQKMPKEEKKANKKKPK